MKRSWKAVIKRFLLHLNRVTEHVGVRIQPVHYYSEVPDRTQLRRNGGWARPISIAGLHWDLNEQLTWLREHCTPYVDELADELSRYRSLTTYSGPGYGEIESQTLHCVVRSLAPRRLVEVGSGFSTFVSRWAANANTREARGDTKITCVEPFPRPGLLELPGVTVVQKTAQTVENSVFDSLESGDLLFIDSTHAVRTGSELARLYLEVLPNLTPGVLIHIHDIYLPYLFAPDFLESIFDWQETTLLAALLTHNPKLRVAACLSALHHSCADGLAAIFPDYSPRELHDGLYVHRRAEGHYPSSTWLLTTGT